MTLHQLELFVAVAETHNLSTASARLRISQPAMTKQLRALGEEYGTQLYVPRGRGIELTPAGERFLRHARKILSAATRLEGDFPPNRSVQTQAFSIGACYQPSALIIPAVVRDFVKSFPAAKMNVTTDTTPVLLHKILAGKLDLAVVLGPLAEHDSVKHEIVSYYTPVILGLPDQSLTRKREVTARDLKDAPLILHQGGPTSKQAMALLRDAGIEPRVKMECPNAEAIKTATKAGLGLGLLFEDHVLAELQTGLQKPVNLHILKAVKMPFYAVYPINQERVLRPFIDLLRSYGEARETH